MHTSSLRFKIPPGGEEFKIFNPIKLTSLATTYDTVLPQQITEVHFHDSMATFFLFVPKFFVLWGAKRPKMIAFGYSYQKVY